MNSLPWKDLEIALQSGLPRFRWFGGKSRTICRVRLEEHIAFPLARNSNSYLCFARIFYSEGQSDLYALPVGFRKGPEAVRLEKRIQNAVFWRGKEHSIFFDATFDPEFRNEVLRFLLKQQETHSTRRSLSATILRSTHRKTKPNFKIVPSRLLGAEQSNTSIVFGEDFILKFYRRMSEGVNPDVEVGRFLTQETSFHNSPAVIGTLDLNSRSPKKEPITLACLYSFLKNKGDAWQVFLQELSRQAKIASNAAPETWAAIPGPQFGLLASSQLPIPDEVRRAFGLPLEWAELLGRRTFEMHAALATASKNNRAFRLEKMTKLKARVLSAALRKHGTLSFHVLGKNLSKLTGSAKKNGHQLMELQNSVLSRLEKLARQSEGVPLIRTHGDYHLGQVLFSGSDFFIIDFEGEPARPLKERRGKHPPLRDVAGMLRSFHYASHVARSQAGPHGDRMGLWFSLWYQWVSAAYLRGYFAGAETARWLPSESRQISALLQVYLLEKSLYELVYELNNRPDWVGVPLSGILELLES